MTDDKCRWQLKVLFVMLLSKLGAAADAVCVCLFVSLVACSKQKYNYLRNKFYEVYDAYDSCKKQKRRHSWMRRRRKKKTGITHKTQQFQWKDQRTTFCTIWWIFLSKGNRADFLMTTIKNLKKESSFWLIPPCVGSRIVCRRCWKVNNLGYVMEDVIGVLLRLCCQLRAKGKHNNLR